MDNQNRHPNKNNAPKCPNCGAKMVLRTATRGIHKGNQFWGCSNYPRCKKIIDLSELNFDNTNENTTNHISDNNNKKRIPELLIRIACAVSGLLLIMIGILIHVSFPYTRRCPEALLVVFGVIMILAAKEK